MHETLSKSLAPFTRSFDAPATAKQALLKQRVSAQLDMLANDAKLLQLIYSITTTRDQPWQRVQSSIQQYRSLFHDKRIFHKYLTEIIEAKNSNGDTFITTPALLVIQALLFGHLGWLRPYHHDVWSACLTQQELKRWYSDMPDGFAKKINIMIVFQNLIRSILGEKNEVRVWDENKILKDDAAIIRVLSRELFSVWGRENNKDRTALVAAITCALSQQITHSKCSSEDMRRFINRARRLINQIKDDIMYETVSGTLLSFEFGNYMFTEAMSVDEFVEISFFREFLSEYKNKNIIMLSFGRFWTDLEIRDFLELINDKKEYSAGSDEKLFLFSKEGDKQQILFQEMFAKETAGLLAHLDLSPAIRFKLFFGDNTRNEDVWSLVEYAIKWIRKRRQWRYNGDEYLPFGAVDRVLRVLQKIWPEKFIQVQLNWYGVSNVSLNERNSTIILPNISPSINDIEGEEIKLIIARYAAAAILNQRMAYGGGQIELYFENVATEDQDAWREAIEWVQNKNHHETLRFYVDQVSTPYHAQLTKFTPNRIDLIKPKYGLCIDVGAGSVKVELWSIDLKDSTYRLNERIATHKYATSLGQNKKYKDGESFADRLKLQIKANDCFKECLISETGLLIAVTWPGPVAGESGAEFVAGTSGILQFFEKTSNQINENTSTDIHALRVREGFQKVFESAVILFMNDGEAHTIAAKKQFESSRSISVTLTAGTGTALGVANNNEPISVLGEVGKFEINLLSPFDATGNFPKGIANKLLSDETAKNLAEDIIRGCAFKGFKAKEPNQVLPIHPLELAIFFTEACDEDEETIDNLKKNWFKVYKSLLEDYQINTWVIPRFFHEYSKENAKEAWRERKASFLHALENFPDPTQITEIAPLIKNLNTILPKDKPLSKQAAFALVVAHRAGCLLADLAAVCIDLFRAKSLFCAGGPLSGATGKLIREFARLELNNLYGISIDRGKSKSSAINLRAVRRLFFPEPKIGEPFSAPWGAGSKALDWYIKLYQEQELQDLADKLHSLQLDDVILIEEVKEEKSRLLVNISIQTQCGAETLKCEVTPFDKIIEFIQQQTNWLTLHPINQSSRCCKYIYLGTTDPTLWA